MSDRFDPRSSQSRRDLSREAASSSSKAAASFDLYEKIAETRPGTRDAEIFEKIRQWTFSDFTVPAHEFAGITRAELTSWQARHRINLSSGQIRPDPIDLVRGYVWGQVRMTSSANRLHGTMGPPSVKEIKQSWFMPDTAALEGGV